MNLDQLRIFVAIVEHGSIRAGARSLGIAQSGLTKQIQRLELNLGATLFTRSNSGIMLTPHGQSLLTRARIILGECERTEQEFRYLQGELSGSVSIGASSEAFAGFLPFCVEQFRQQHPKVSIHIASGPSAVLLSGIREGRHDFAVTLVSRGSDMADLSRKRMTVSHPRILCRQGHPLQSVQSIHDLVTSEWVNTGPLGHNGTPSNRLGDWFTKNGLKMPTIVVTVESLLDTLNLISNTNYLFLGPAFVVEKGDFKNTLTTIPIIEPLPYSEISLIQRAAVPLAPAAEIFASMLISYARVATKRIKPQ